MTERTQQRAVVTPTATEEEVAELRGEQLAEYGTYVALTTIPFNGTTAYVAGDAVPVSNVKAHGYEQAGLVAKVDSAAGKKLMTSLHESSVSQVVEQGPPVTLGVPVPGTK